MNDWYIVVVMLGFVFAFNRFIGVQAHFEYIFIIIWFIWRRLEVDKYWFYIRVRVWFRIYLRDFSDLDSYYYVLLRYRRNYIIIISNFFMGDFVIFFLYGIFYFCLMIIIDSYKLRKFDDSKFYIIFISIIRRWFVIMRYKNFKGLYLILEYFKEK